MAGETRWLWTDDHGLYGRDLHRPPLTLRLKTTVVPFLPLAPHNAERGAPVPGNDDKTQAICAETLWGANKVATNTNNP